MGDPCSHSETGFTMVEMLITMVIVSIVVGIAYYAYNKLATEVSNGSVSVEGAMDKIVGLELMRLDIAHAGFGIARDETCPPVRWISANDPSDPCDSDLENSLVLRSTMNNTNQSTMGWLLVECKENESWQNHIIIDEREVSTVNTIVFLDYRGQFGFSATSSTNCPRDANYIGYPVVGTNECNVQTCSRVAYTLSTTQSLSLCADGTKNLLRKVGAGSGSPILNCVADWDLRFGLDTDGDGAVDTVSTGSGLPTTPADIRSQLKYISVYALIQAGNYDAKYNYGNNVTVDNNVTLTFPAGCTKCPNYHWKVLKKTIKLMNL